MHVRLNELVPSRIEYAKPTSTAARTFAASAIHAAPPFAVSKISVAPAATAAPTVSSLSVPAAATTYAAPTYQTYTGLRAAHSISLPPGDRVGANGLGGNPDLTSAIPQDSAGTPMKLGHHTWTRHVGDVFVLKGGLSDADIKVLANEIERIRHHETPHIRGPFVEYDQTPGHAKLLCTFNYYTEPRPGEPVPAESIRLGNSFLADFGMNTESALIIQYPRSDREPGDRKLQWHVDAKGKGGPLVTMSWGAACDFLWRVGGQALSVKVGPGDVVFFDGGLIEHAVRSVCGERFNIQCRVKSLGSKQLFATTDANKMGTHYPYGHSKYLDHKHMLPLVGFISASLPMTTLGATTYGYRSPA